MRHTALWILKSQINDLQISPKLSVARDLPQTYRQTVPQTRRCQALLKFIVDQEIDRQVSIALKYSYTKNCNNMFQYSFL